MEGWNLQQGHWHRLNSKHIVSRKETLELGNKTDEEKVQESDFIPYV